MTPRLAMAVVLAGLVLGVTAPPALARDRVVHRVVWNAERLDGPNFRMYSAKRDGSDQRLIYRRETGFTLDLTMSRDGSHVAFVVMPKGYANEELVVLDVLTGEQERPLADVERIPAIDQVGWSPDGHRLAFVGAQDLDGERRLFLWTVGVDGSHLRRLTEIDNVQGRPTGGSIAWTSRGIFYPDRHGLERWSSGRVHPVLPRVGGLQVSGNGRWLFFGHSSPRGQHGGYWRMRPDGSDLERLFGFAREGWMVEGLVPDHRGRRLLSSVEAWGARRAKIVVGPVTLDPRAALTELSFVPSYSFPIAWG